MKGNPRKQDAESRTRRPNVATVPSIDHRDSDGPEMERPTAREILRYTPSAITPTEYASVKGRLARPLSICRDVS